MAQTNETITQQNKSDSEKTSTDVEQITISGRVTDLVFGDPIPDVLITIENIEIKTYTNKGGKYSLTFDKDLEKETLVTFFFTDFLENKTPILELLTSPDIVLNEREYDESELVYTGKICAPRKTTFFQRIGNIFRKNKNK